MPFKAESITNYKFNDSDELLLDANIWLLAYAPQSPTSRRVAVYSKALSEIIASKGHIYIDVLVVSEFINRCARMEQQLLPQFKNVNFKAFRQSPEFALIAKGIAANVKRILQYCTKVESGFDSPDIEALITEYAAGKSDFNDQILTALCKRKGFKLVTDDGDFKGQEVHVVTANTYLLAP